MLKIFLHFLWRLSQGGLLYFRRDKIKLKMFLELRMIPIYFLRCVLVHRVGTDVLGLGIIRMVFIIGLSRLVLFCFVFVLFHVLFTICSCLLIQLFNFIPS